MRGVELKVWRRDRGHTQTTLGVALDVAVRSIATWEKLETELPSLLQLALDQLSSGAGPLASDDEMTSVSDWREKHGYTQADLAASVGVSRQTVVSWEAPGAKVTKVVRLALKRLDNTPTMFGNKLKPEKVKLERDRARGIEADIRAGLKKL